MQQLTVEMSLAPTCLTISKKEKLVCAYTLQYVLFCKTEREVCEYIFIHLDDESSRTTV